MTNVWRPDAMQAAAAVRVRTPCQKSDQSTSSYFHSSLKTMLELTALVVLLPIGMVLMMTIALTLWLFEGGPVFFSQDRVGKDGQTFKCLKFRTMCPNADVRLQDLLSNDPQMRMEWETSRKLQSDPRISWLGGFLRKSSMDELPQLINVLSGEMALVGPRPVVADELRLYGRYQEHYKSVRPGLTGLWQVNGRSDTSYQRRVALDVTYVRNASIWLDLWVLFKTISIVANSRGAV